MHMTMLYKHSDDVYLVLGGAYDTMIDRGLSNGTVQHLDKYFRIKAKHLATIGCLQTNIVTL